MRVILGSRKRIVLATSARFGIGFFVAEKHQSIVLVFLLPVVATVLRSLFLLWAARTGHSTSRRLGRLVVVFLGALLLDVHKLLLVDRALVAFLGGQLPVVTVFMHHDGRHRLLQNEIRGIAPLDSATRGLLFGVGSVATSSDDVICCRGFCR